MRDAQLIEHTGDDEIDQVIHAFRMVVEAGVGGENHDAGIGKSQHVFKMQHRERRFARHQYQAALFLDHDICRSFYKTVGETRCDRGESPH